MTKRKMESLFGVRFGKQKSSPLEGLASFRAQMAEVTVQQLARREWWMWFSAVVVTVLSALALLLTSFRSLFLRTDHFYELRPEQVRWGVFSLLLLFNGWMVYRQRSFRRLRRQAAQQNTESFESTYELPGSSGGLDPVTGLLTRGGVEQQLGKEIARARRQNTALSVATLHLDDLAELIQRHGKSAVDEALKEFARRLKEVSRGSDYAVRLANEDFLLVLPKCNAGEVTRVLNRVGQLEITCSGKRISLAYTTGWVDYQPGDLPADLIKRATQLLHLYENAAKDSFASTLAPH
ncbi:MAG TPA: GGDEF domain-containing protein [Candidatus Acidoferrum sp.]|nr:GGDEF domain-containing protein [Candidatus Acidoferrum sp.]